MAGNQAKRHIPKRASNPKSKETRAGSYAAGERRKNARRAAQDAAARRNAATRASGGLTPWEAAREARRIRRASAHAADAAGRPGKAS